MDDRGTSARIALHSNVRGLPCRYGCGVAFVRPAMSSSVRVLAAVAADRDDHELAEHGAAWLHVPAERRWREKVGRPTGRLRDEHSGRGAARR